jgi:hypothetical protein
MLRVSRTSAPPFDPAIDICRKTTRIRSGSAYDQARYMSSRVSIGRALSLPHSIIEASYSLASSLPITA